MTQSDSTLEISLWRHPAFLRFLYVRVAASVALQIQVVAVGWQMYDVDRQPVPARADRARAIHSGDLSVPLHRPCRRSLRPALGHLHRRDRRGGGGRRSRGGEFHRPPDAESSSRHGLRRRHRARLRAAERADRCCPISCRRKCCRMPSRRRPRARRPRSSPGRRSAAFWSRSVRPWCSRSAP